MPTSPLALWHHWRQMASLEAEMLAFIRRGLDHHNSSCPMPARAILLNPGNCELFGWDELWGVPVLADERVAPKRFRIDCDGSALAPQGENPEAPGPRATAQQPPPRA